MTSWTTTREQWVSWVAEAAVLAEPPLVLDAWDGQFLQVLRAVPFGQDAAATNASLRTLDPLATYDSMPTMVRSGEGREPDDDVDAAQTLVHGARSALEEEEAASLEVGLQSTAGGLQIDLEPNTAESDWYIPPLTERSSVGPAPQAPTGDPTAGQAAVPPDATPPTPADRTTVAPAPGFEAQPGDGRAEAAIRTGTTLVPIEPEAASTQTAGEIVTLVEDEAEPPPPRRSSKIVVAQVPEVAVVPTDGDSEPDVLESSDLLEAMDPVEMPPLPPVSRAPSPSPPPPRESPPPPRAPAPDVAAAYITGQTLPPAGARHWSEAVFASHFAALARQGADQIAAAEVEFIAEITQLAASASVIDVGCGEGRHANAFSDRGHRTVGLDASQAQIHLATESFGLSVPKLRWLCQDVRDRGVGEQFDLVTCLGTALGIYDEAQNRVVLEALRDLCAPDGRIVIHVVNRDYVVPRLPARTWWQGQGCLVLDEVDVHDPTSRVNVKRTIVFEDGRQFEHVYDVRVYAVHELVLACEAAGLTVLEVSGSRHTRARFFGATSPDIWLVARR